MQSIMKFAKKFFFLCEMIQKCETMETYGNLDFSLAHREVLFVVDVHTLECILGVIATFNQKHNRKTASIFDKKREELFTKSGPNNFAKLFHRSTYLQLISLQPPRNAC